MAVYRYKTESGQERWRAVVDAPPDQVTGKRRQISKKGFTRKKDAELAEREIQDTIDLGVVVVDKGTIVADYLRSWVKGLSVDATTRSDYQNSIENHLIPTAAPDGRERPGIGRLRLTDLQPEHLDYLYRWMEEQGKQIRGRDPKTKKPRTGGTPLRPKSIRNVHGCIHKALEDAVERKYVARNVAALAKPPSSKQAKSKKAQDCVWTPEEARTFLDYARVDRPLLYPLFLLALTTGMRRSELVGLRWPHVNLDAAELRVRWTITQVRGKVVEKDLTKTDAGERTIDLDRGTVEVLRRHRVEQRKLELASSAWRNDEHRVFTMEDGRGIQPLFVLRNAKRIAEAAGVPVTDVHSLRHTYATQALLAGVHVKVVQERVGHSDPSITLGIYTHVNRQQHKEAAETAAAAVLGEAR